MRNVLSVEHLLESALKTKVFTSSTEKLVLKHRSIACEPFANSNATVKGSALMSVDDTIGFARGGFMARADTFSDGGLMSRSARNCARFMYGAVFGEGVFFSRGVISRVVSVLGAVAIANRSLPTLEEEVTSMFKRRRPPFDVAMLIGSVGAVFVSKSGRAQVNFRLRFL